MIVGMLISIFGVAFSASFNTPSLIASLATEHGMLPKWIGKKNKHDAPYVGIIFTAVLSGALATQSYLFLVSCTVLASFVQYVPSILAVIKFKHSNEYPTHVFYYLENTLFQLLLWLFLVIWLLTLLLRPYS